MVKSNKMEMDSVGKIAGKKDVLEYLKEVNDPEIPALSVIDLGMIEDVIISGDSVIVKMIPTFTACPAIKFIQNSIKNKLLDYGFEDVHVLIDSSVAWNSDRMTAEAKKKLELFGLGTPKDHKGTFKLKEIEQCRCPHCGSENTTMNSLFGSTLCRSMHYCFDCKQSFERFKPIGF
jgi:ring-1,2-phenylacetyl-CoA epoxidase subunit PaaD